MIRPNAYCCSVQQDKANGLCVPRTLADLRVFHVFGRGAFSVLNALTRALLCGCSFALVVSSALRIIVVHIYFQTHDDWFMLYRQWHPSVARNVSGHQTDANFCKWKKHIPCILCKWVCDINLNFVEVFISNSRKDFTSSWFSKNILRTVELCDLVDG
jgi:hypothetical protein